MLLPYRSIVLYSPRGGVAGSDWLVRLYVIAFVPMSVNYVLLNHFNVVQRRAMALTLIALENIVLYLPLIWVLTHALGLVGAVASFVCAEALTTVVTPLVVGDDARPLKQQNGTLLGLFDDIDLVDETVTLAPGESLLVFTDGVTEAVDKNKAFLGDAAFAERLSARAPFASAQSVVDATTQIVDAHAAGHEQFDDLTALALTHTNVHTDTEDNAPSPTVTAAPAAEKSLPVVGAHEVPADITSMDIVKEAIFATGVDGPLKCRTTLAVEEAFANVVSYSGATHAWYAVEELPAGLSVTLIDDGDPFGLTTAEAPDPEFEDLEFGGMGLRIVRQLATDVRYRYKDGLNVLVIEVEQ
ncbi:Histidine kinase-like ATPase domain-containing protein [Olsenella sp. KH1P3]|uniref:Histidine kinase-like ATPase domain-containing protein n=1 Tax=Parafannyhessea umbonata TaxID=604330 RepID=A0A1H6HLS2_9ACTN|nr:Histidine kinase-like ATPase domain-containing protein [Parafannyhessea umbonata]SJZ38520.1 Histidine kinase-like ATPase domain-containing protein [Olsenella sp. KH1P3]